LSKEIGELYKSGKKAEADALKEQSTALKEESIKLRESLEEFEKQLQDLLIRLPNLPSEKVPAGKGAEQNEMVYSEGEKPTLGANALPHWELAAKYDIIDFRFRQQADRRGIPCV
jgi:seryl-tRNA synthetase